MTLAHLLNAVRGMGMRMGGGPDPAIRPGSSLGFPKSDFGQHRPRRACWGRLGIRVARSVQPSWRSGC